MLPNAGQQLTRSQSGEALATLGRRSLAIKALRLDTLKLSLLGSLHTVHRPCVEGVTRALSRSVQRAPDSVMPQSSAGILQVVSGDGEFKEDSVISFMRDNDVQDAGVDYQVVAITGPQSSGKSTLMNALVCPHCWKGVYV